jgi:hypothetical protein
VCAGHKLHVANSTRAGKLSLVRDIIVALASSVDKRDASESGDDFAFAPFPAERYLVPEEIGISVCQCARSLGEGYKLSSGPDLCARREEAKTLTVI